MPEYLTPGVFLEETSFRGRPIEGVSTSTAGLVGRARKGREGVPTLVTSLTQFVREFGDPLASPSGGAGDYLGHAVRAFFDNGGARAYIVRVLGAGALASDTSSATNRAHGLVARLPTNAVVLAGITVVPLQSLRGLQNTTKVFIFRRPSSQEPFAQVSSSAGDGSFEIASYDALASTITLNEALPSNLEAANTYLRVDAVPPSTAIDADKLPAFAAISRGVAGDSLSVRFSPADRPLIKVTADVTATDTVLTVANTGGVYSGALLEVDSGSAKAVVTVASVDADLKQITLSAAVGIAFTIPATGAKQYVRVLEFRVEVLEDGDTIETFDGVVFNPDTTVDSYSRYYIEQINDPDTGSRQIVATAPATGPSAVLADQPTSTDGDPIALSGGDDGLAPTDTELIGSDGGPGLRTGIQSLKERDDISIVAVPGVTSEAVQAALITHAELEQYRVAVLDAPQSTGVVTEILSHRNAYDSTHAAYYTPWLETLDLASGRTIEVPPSGHVIGIYARTDNTRGVWKAPANETIRNITGLKYAFTDGEQDVLNPVGVNVIREFTGRGIRVWGARTISSNSEWKYLNVRRLFAFLEASIDRGTQWVVFEPNGPELWDRVSRTINSFLFGVWSSGALLGTTPEEAYFVRCDRTTMTQDDIDNGRLICLIGIAPIKPAEFVIFRIGQFTATE